MLYSFRLFNRKFLGKVTIQIVDADDIVRGSIECDDDMQLNWWRNLAHVNSIPFNEGNSGGVG